MTITYFCWSILIPFLAEELVKGAAWKENKSNQISGAGGDGDGGGRRVMQLGGGQYVKPKGPACQTCKLETEDEAHFLLRCPLYQVLRETLHRETAVKR